jgi:poly-gamma-glutamate system protein
MDRLMQLRRRSEQQPFRPPQGRWSLDGRPVLRWVLCLVAFGLFLLGAAQTPVPYQPVAGGFERAQARRQAIDYMKEAMLSLGAAAPFVEVNSNDPNGTQLIGVEWSAITSTLGDLEAKRTALSPLWAAIIVDELAAADIGQGDTIAVSLSGSFPGLNLAVLAAAKAMGIQVRAVASPTASMYGANRPDWTWTDMMRHLADSGWLVGVEWRVTAGGGQDLGMGLLEADLHTILPILARSGAEVITGGNLAEMIEGRWAFYWAGDRVAAFINVGGAHATTGDCAPPAEWHGWLTRNWSCRGVPGLLWRFRAAEVPTFHLLNVKELALRYGLPIDPIPLPGWNDVQGSAR